MFDPRFEFYAITDQASAKGRSDIEIAAALIQGGATTLQYRAKKVSAKEQWQTAVALRVLTKQHDVQLVINDRVDLALECEADGVHLGQDDLPIASARRLAGERLFVGRSTHSLEQAKEAAAEGADYIGYGPLYATQTKENNVPPVGVESLGAVIRAVDIAVVAIGGIKFEQLAAVAAQGARHVAVVTALTGADDPAEQAASYLRQFRLLNGH